MNLKTPPWPLPALITWALAWGGHALALRLGAPLGLAMALASGLGLACALTATRPWRRGLMAVGYPMSLLVSGAAGGLSPGWWLLPLGLLLLLYPLGAWRDAPLFPTPVGALDGLAQQAPLASGARVVDAGCGLGAGLHALQRAYAETPVHIEGLEWSWPLVLACRWRCPGVRVRRADIWTADWSGYDLVYLFQRPESMRRAVDKAHREMRPGSWLVSLEFQAEGVKPTAKLASVPGKPVWLYRVPSPPGRQAHEKGG